MTEIKAAFAGKQTSMSTGRGHCCCESAQSPSTQGLASAARARCEARWRREVYIFVSAETWAVLCTKMSERKLYLRAEGTHAGVENLTTANPDNAVRAEKHMLHQPRAVWRACQPVVAFLLIVRMNNKLEGFGFFVGDRSAGIRTITTHWLEM